MLFLREKYLELAIIVQSGIRIAISISLGNPLE